MAKYNVEKLMNLARQNGMVFNLNYLDTGHQRIYDFDVAGKTRVRRIKLVTFKSGKRLFPDTANVYVGRSSKYGIEFDSHEDLVKKVRDF